MSREYMTAEVSCQHCGHTMHLQFWAHCPVEWLEKLQKVVCCNGCDEIHQRWLQASDTIDLIRRALIIAEAKDTDVVQVIFEKSKGVESTTVEKATGHWLRIAMNRRNVADLQFRERCGYTITDRKKGITTRTAAKQARDQIAAVEVGA